MVWRIFGLMDMAYRIRSPGRKFQRTLYEAFEDVVRALRKHEVPFMVHGAWALAAYGFERATIDVDFLVPGDAEAVERVFALMKKLKAVPTSPGPQSATQAIARGSRHIQFNLLGWTVDFFFDREFAALRRRAKRKKFGDQVVYVISPGDLKSRKRARGTDQDLVDIKRLESAEE